MNSFSGMHERIRRCTKGSADAQKDPQMHKRIRLAYPPPYIAYLPNIYTSLDYRAGED